MNRVSTKPGAVHVNNRVIDAQALVPQHRERIYIVGFRDAEDSGRFKFPELEDQQPSLAEILDEDVGEKYTLSDHLWGYLQDYARKHRSRGNGFGFGLPDLQGASLDTQRPVLQGWFGDFESGRGIGRTPDGSRRESARG